MAFVSLSSLLRLYRQQTPGAASALAIPCCWIARRPAECWSFPPRIGARRCDSCWRQWH